MTLSLARKFRPTAFTGRSGVYGQDHVARPLQQAVRDGTADRVYMFTGPRGTGKTTLARVLAMALNCQNRAVDGNPCAECDSCRRIHGGHGTLDVQEIDAAANRGVEDARNLRERIRYAASAPGATKVVVLDEAHMLTKEAWNALLKLLEEPPPGVVLVACTTEPATIESTSAAAASRFVRFDLRRLSMPEIDRQIRYIAEESGFEIEEGASLLISRLADGGMRDALQALDQIRLFSEDGRITVNLVRKAKGVPDESMVLAAIDILAGGGSSENRLRVKGLIEALDRTGGAYALFYRDLHDALYGVYLAAIGDPVEGGWTEAGRQQVASLAQKMNPGQMDRIFSALREYRDVIHLGGAEVSLFAALQAGISAAWGDS